MFDPEALTIGFARRFATYKRAGLLFSDLHRLRQLVGNAERPVQIVLAGKAHPADKGGQELIQHSSSSRRRKSSRGASSSSRTTTCASARMLVQGVDVWLNTPRKPLEASGTSGMKAAMNGALNCSIADGWWPEAHDGAERLGHRRQGSAERRAARRIARMPWRSTTCSRSRSSRSTTSATSKKLPRRWLAMMKEAIATITPRFSSDRMVRDYATGAYLPLLRGD